MSPSAGLLFCRQLTHVTSECLDPVPVMHMASTVPAQANQQREHRLQSRMRSTYAIRAATAVDFRTSVADATPQCAQSTVSSSSDTRALSNMSIAQNCTKFKLQLSATVKRARARVGYVLANGDPAKVYREKGVTKKTQGPKGKQVRPV